ncbi:MAG: SDR family oxidoreductase [Ardenticatenaceae bacterium]|nr:SDR family oxidoreductase [Ardenticatenaceae bacterium]
MNLNGKTALITGGAHRVGREITLALAAAGANVVINYNRSADAAEETADAAREVGVGALPIQCDVADAEQVGIMVAAANAQFGGVDILINSASLFKPTPLPTADFSDWHRVFDISVHGAWYCANAVAPYMLEQGEGAIINIVDGSAWQPYPNFAAHGVGKAALMALTRQLALELAPAVRVNAVSPGPVLPPPDFSEKEIAEVAAGTLLKRWGTPADVSEAVLFLLRASYITADVIMVDAGEQYAHRGN